MTAPRGPRRRLPGRSAPLVILVVLLLVFVPGCVSVPTAGPVEQAGRGGTAPENEQEVVPKPPVQDGSPRVIIDGFLLAMTRYQTNYDTARQFLSEEAAQSWRPDDGVTVYTSPTYNSTDRNVVLEMSQIGQVRPDGSYNALSRPITHDFEMVQNADGQWRISHPPPGLLISDTSFSAHFSPFNLYFFDPQFRNLVPDPIYLPSDGRTESALVQALLRGPTTRVRPAVTSAFGSRTSLVGNAVTVERDVAQISLGPQAQSLSQPQRIRMVTQLAWTLRQVEDDPLRGLQVTVNGTPLQVPGRVGEGQNAYIPISYGGDFSPVQTPLKDILIGIQEDAVTMIGNDGASISPIQGPLGQPGYDLNNLALSTDGRTVAAVTNDRTTLLTQPFAGGEVRTRMSEEQRLLRPDYSRHGELWTVSGKPGNQQIRTVDDEKINTIEADWVNRLRIKAFRISPDGSRMALIGSDGQRQFLAIAPILRGDDVRLGTLRPVQLVDTASVQVNRLADLGWVSSTRLLVLGASGEGASFDPYGVEIDGSQLGRVGTSDDWGAKTLATQVNADGSFRAVVAGRANRMWSYQSGDRWEKLSSDISDPAYPN